MASKLKMSSLQWKDHISGVRVKSNYKYSQRVAYQNGDNVFAWRLKIHCFDPTVSFLLLQ